jgi:hypothetical protein
MTRACLQNGGTRRAATSCARVAAGATEAVPASLNFAAARNRSFRPLRFVCLVYFVVSPTAWFRLIGRERTQRAQRTGCHWGGRFFSTTKHTNHTKEPMLPLLCSLRSLAARSWVRRRCRAAKRPPSRPPETAWARGRSDKWEQAEHPLNDA